MKNNNIAYYKKNTESIFCFVAICLIAMRVDIACKSAYNIPKIEIRSNKISRYKVNMSLDGNNDTINGTIYSIVTRDLDITKLFDIRTIKPDQQVNSSNSKVEFLCHLDIIDNGKTIDARIKIHDVKRFGDPSDTNNTHEFLINGHKKDVSLLSHKIANKIFETITNMNGFFDTKIIYVEDTTDTSAKSAKCKDGTINSNTSTKLVQMDFSGINSTDIVKSSANGIVLSPRYSPDNQKIAYVAFDRKAKDNKGKVFNIYVYDAKRKKSTIVIDNKITKALTNYFKGKIPQMSYAPRFSQDSNNIIFAMISDGTSAIYNYDFTNKKITILTKHRYNIRKAIDTSPCYINGDKGIIFTSDKYGIEQIFTMSIDGKNERRLTNKIGKYSQPVYSPNGHLVAFTKQQNNQFYICTMDIDGKNEKELVSGYLVEEPCFSPDGRYIAFTYSPSATSNSRIAVVDITGRHMFILKTPLNKSCSSPAWSNPYNL